MDFSCLYYMTFGRSLENKFGESTNVMQRKYSLTSKRRKEKGENAAVNLKAVVKLYGVSEPVRKMAEDTVRLAFFNTCRAVFNGRKRDYFICDMKVDEKAKIFVDAVKTFAELHHIEYEVVDLQTEKYNRKHHTGITVL